MKNAARIGFFRSESVCGSDHRSGIFARVILILVYWFVEKWLRDQIRFQGIGRGNFLRLLRGSISRLYLRRPTRLVVVLSAVMDLTHLRRTGRDLQCQFIRNSTKGHPRLASGFIIHRRCCPSLHCVSGGLCCLDFRALLLTGCVLEGDCLLSSLISDQQIATGI